MVDKMTCPKCGSSWIEEEDCYDVETFSKGVKTRHIGFCMDCGAQLQWSEVYHFVGYAEIEED